MLEQGGGSHPSTRRRAPHAEDLRVVWRSRRGGGGEDYRQVCKWELGP
ncbi:MAG: hypothetical protein ACK4M3_00330, partial [Pyrobaculum sp.]